MKHLTNISRIQTVPANATQDFLCFAAEALNAFLTIIGGALPVTTFVEGKCAIPVANESGDGGGEGTGA